MFSAADQTAFVTASPHKATATLPTTLTVDGIFTKPTRMVDQFTGSVNTTDPAFTVTGADRTTHEIDIGSYLTIDSVEYSVVDLMERNDGMVGLQLQRYTEA